MNRVKHLLFRHVWVFVCALLTGAGVYALFGAPITHPQKAGATSIVITSPAEGQKFEGTNLRVSGSTTANSTVLLLSNNKVVKQLISDSSGNWAADLTDLPSGENTITARVIESSGYAYFTSIADANLSSPKINQLRLSDNAINPTNGWPISPTSPFLGMQPAPTGSTFYAIGGSGGPPAKFDAANPADPVAPINYPQNPAANLGAFSADGLKYYSPNDNLTTVSVVDVVSNTWLSDIELGVSPATAMSGPNGKIYITANPQKLFVVDPIANNSVKEVATTCNGSMAILSRDTNYPYYFVSCINDGIIEKRSVSNDSLVASFNVGNNPTGGVITLDNAQIYIFDSSFGQAVNSDKLRVFNTDNGQLVNTVQLSAGAGGFLPSPDYQKLYIATAGNSLDTKNIDVYNITTGTISHITPDDFAALVSIPSASALIANISVGVVLGAKADSLANTGVRAVSATLLLGVIFGSSSYIYYDYRRHKKPLAMVDPNVHYNLIHHVRVVTLPILKYRVSFAYGRSTSSNGDSTIHKF